MHYLWRCISSSDLPICANTIECRHLWNILWPVEASVRIKIRPWFTTEARKQSVYVSCAKVRMLPSSKAKRTGVIYHLKKVLTKLRSPPESFPFPYINIRDSKRRWEELEEKEEEDRVHTLQDNAAWVTSDFYHIKREFLSIANTNFAEVAKQDTFLCTVKSTSTCCVVSKT